MPRRTTTAAVAATAVGALGLSATGAFVSGVSAPAAAGTSAKQAALRGVSAAAEAQAASSAAQPTAQAILGQSLAGAAAAVGAAGLAARRRQRRAGAQPSKTARGAFFNPFAWNAKKTVVITGASSGLGLATAKELAMSGDWLVIMACRDFVKAEKVAKEQGFPEGSYKVMHLDLSANNSVRNFVRTFRSLDKPLDALVCNAAVYFPNAHKAGVIFPGLFAGGGPRWSADGHELSFAANYLGHFLLVKELLDDLQRASQPRCIILGTVTASVNGKELGGMVPPLADLGNLSGLEGGMQKPNTMIDGGEFDGAKAYKDSKVCNVMHMRELHKRYHASTGINFSSLYPGCIAETGLFREHYPLFQSLFPVFQQNVTRAYVSEDEAGRRLAAVVSDPEYNKSGSYYSWQGASGTGGMGGMEGKDNVEETQDFFMNKGSFRTLAVDEIGGEAGNDENCRKLWELSERLIVEKKAPVIQEVSQEVKEPALA